MRAILTQTILAARRCAFLIAILLFIRSVAFGQDQPSPSVDTNATAQSISQRSTLDSVMSDLWQRRLGPFSLHPRLMGNFTYDNNILLSTTGKEADEIYMVQPGIQAVAGDDAALLSFRQEYNDVLGMTPGNLIVVPSDWRPGRLLILDYAPRLQEFQKYSANDSLDQFLTLDFLYPLRKLIIGVKQDYTDQKTTIVEAAERTTVESITTTLSGAYEFGDKTSAEITFHRLDLNYSSTNLLGYAEYNTEDWFNYKLHEDIPVSVGIIAGEDIAANRQGQTYEQIRARGRYLRTQKLTLDISAGGELRQYQNGNPMVFNPVFTLTGEYRPTQRSAIRLTAFRQLYAAILNGYYYASTGATVDLFQGITDRYTATLSMGYYSIDETTLTRPIATHTESYSSVRVTFAAKIVKHFTGSVFGQWLRTSQSSGGLEDTQVGLQLNLNY